MQALIRRARIPAIASLFLALNIFSGPAAAQFAKGADVGWLTEMEAAGLRWYNDSGVQQDLFQILKDHGMDTIRLRVWVNPAGGWNGQEDVIAKAVRARDAGMRIMIDFHYSDSWADPGKQFKPAAWNGHSFSQLQTDVYNHTYTVLNALAAHNVVPEWVQVGNETDDGMLWDDGRISVNARNFALLVDRGYAAVKAVNPNIKVIVHISRGNENARFRQVFDGLRSNGARWDVIGMSLYPTATNWQTLNNSTLANMNDMRSRYGKDVMMVEVGMRYDEPTASRAFLADIIAKTRQAGGLGVLYWEPQTYNWGYEKGAWGTNGRPTVALDAFLEGGTQPGNSTRILSRSSGKCMDVSRRSTSSRAIVVQYTCGSGANQQWTAESMTGGFVRLKASHSGMCLELASQSTANSVGLIQATCGSGTSQLWAKQDAGSGYYRLMNRFSGKCADVPANSTANDVQLIQYTCGTANNQQWVNN